MLRSQRSVHTLTMSLERVPLAGFEPATYRVEDGCSESAELQGCAGWSGPFDGKPLPTYSLGTRSTKPSTGPDAPACVVPSIMWASVTRSE